ncbi:MAG: hypothetical protein ACYC5M_11130 [Anaerolineae bacterium]
MIRFSNRDVLRDLGGVLLCIQRALADVK